MAKAQSAGEYKGKKMFFEHISYNCPSLGLWGYSTETALKRAISKKLSKTRK